MTQNLEICFYLSGSNIDTTDGTTAGTVLRNYHFWCLQSRNYRSNSRHCWFCVWFSQSYTQASDAVPSAAVSLGAAPNFSSVTSYAAGDNTALAGTVTSAGVLTVTAGGAWYICDRTIC